MNAFLLGSILGNLALSLVASIIIYSILRTKTYAFYASIVTLEVVFCARFAYLFEFQHLNIIYIAVSIGILLIAIYKIIELRIIEIKIKLPRFNLENKTKPLMVICAILICCVSYLIYYTISLQNRSDYLNTQIKFYSEEVEDLEGQISNLKNKNMDYLNNQDSIKDELLFYRSTAVIVTETGSKYHAYGCPHIQDSDFWIYNIDLAQQRGYRPCSDCMPNIFNIEYDTGIDWDEINKQTRYKQ